MTGDWQRSKTAGRFGRIALGAAIAVLLAAQAVAQEPQTPPAASGQEAGRQPPPGLLQEIGRWFEDSAARLHSNLRATRGTLDDLGDRASGAAKDAADAAKDAAKDTADAVARLPGARIVEARERCGPAANGAPDCRLAAEAICRGKGFASGKSVDIQSAQKCSARVWLSGRKPNLGECETESFVTKAVCQ